MPKTYRLKDSELAADSNIARIEVGSDGRASVTYIEVQEIYSTLGELVAQLGLSADDLEPLQP